MTIYIDKNGNRFNPKSTHVVGDVAYYGNILDFPDAMQTLGISTVEEPLPPENYNEELWDKQETNTFPYVIYAPKNQEEVSGILIKKFVASMEAHFDSVANVKNYDTRYTCALRAGYSGPFQSEGQAFALWMDSCNAYGYQELQKIKDGTRSVPTVEEFLSELPSAPW